MKNYKIGDVLIRKDGGIRVISHAEDRVFFLAAIRDDGTVRALPHFKSMVMSDHYKKVVL